MEDCIFCKIANKKMDTKFVYEDKEIMAFNDIRPIAPVHVLIVPKRHIESVNDLTKDDTLLVGNMTIIAKDIAKKLKISEGGYKLLFRTGKHGGQEIDHIHLHLIGGAPLHEEIKPMDIPWERKVN